MQAIISRAFANRTVIAIAHQLKTMMDYDRVVVLDAGRIVELGNPKELMADENSLFGALASSQNLK
jgi:ATP-binding cassette subfamily C (CFTR/MRP) protein 1